MGGFAGGDEGGYWDIDILPTSMDQQNDNQSENFSIKKSDIEIGDSIYSIKAHARVKSLSGWIRVEDLYDTITFVPDECKTFTIEGCDNIPLESNTIYKAFLALYDFTNDSDILDFFYTHKVVVTKRIPPSAGPGGSASDAAAFIRLVKEVCNLILSTDELAKIGSSITPDIPFFIYN
ncbi:MAG: hypothetical protein Q8S36_01800 [Sulfuricurvum sp.]|nr:hypothetical protein [Sulfuricurvum sp.]